jgi:predicted Zn-dependent protease
MVAPPPAAFQGVYFDGRSAGRHAVSVTVHPGSLSMVTSDGATIWWPLHEVRQTAGAHRGEPVRLERGGPPSEVLEVADPRLLDAIRAINPGARFSGSSARRSFALKLAALAAGCVLPIVAAYLWLLPAIGEAAASVVPVSFEEQLGRAVLDFVAPQGKRCTPPVLAEIFARLQAVSAPSPYTFHVYVADDPMVNALAAPGGYIVVFRGLLEKTASPDEAAAVLAHEMQHVLERHSTRALMRDLTWRALLALIAGDTQGVLVGLAGTLGELRYRRQDEEAADRGALRTLERARLDPAGMIHLLRTLEKESAEAPALFRYLSTHPPMRDRLARMEQAAAQSRYQPVPLLPGQPWPPQGLCRGR